MEDIMYIIYELCIRSHDLNAIRTFQQAGRARAIAHVAIRTGRRPPVPLELIGKCCVCLKPCTRTCLGWPQFVTMQVCYSCIQKPLFQVYSQPEIKRAYHFTQRAIDDMIRRGLIHCSSHYNWGKGSSVFMKWQIEQILKDHPEYVVTEEMYFKRLATAAKRRATMRRRMGSP